MDGPIRIMELMDTDFDYPTVLRGHSVSLALGALAARCRSGKCRSHNSESLVLVINHENQLEGVINLEALSKSIDSGVYNMAARVPGGGVINEADCIAHLLPDCRVEEIMLPVDKIALKSTDPVNKALNILLNNDVGTLPVLNIFRCVIGMVHAADVFHILGLDSSFCKLAFMGYGYFGHGTINVDIINSRKRFHHEVYEKKLKPRVGSLHKFNPKTAIIAVLVGLMLSPLCSPEMPQTKILNVRGAIGVEAGLHKVFLGRDTGQAGTMAMAFNNMVTMLQDKTVKLPPFKKGPSAYGQGRTGCPN